MESVHIPQRPDSPYDIALANVAIARTRLFARDYKDAEPYYESARAYFGDDEPDVTFEHNFSIRDIRGTLWPHLHAHLKGIRQESSRSRRRMRMRRNTSVCDTDHSFA